MILEMSAEERVDVQEVDNEEENRPTNNDASLARVLKRKLKKKLKKEETKKVKLESFWSNNVSIYQHQKKLLIFDLNKVLIHRQKGCTDFVPRPHVEEFLQAMSQRYVLAVWSSMKRNSAWKVLRDLFTTPKVDLLFTWFQNRCTVIKHNGGVSTETEEPQDELQTSDHPQPSNPLFDTVKPTFYKKLRYVWLEYPQFNETNTILLDDTEEKCIHNPIYTSIHPLPYYYVPPNILAKMQQQCEDRKNITEIVQPDEELKPQGSLWTYLDLIAQSDGSVQECFKRLGPYLHSSFTTNTSTITLQSTTCTQEGVASTRIIDDTSLIEQTDVGDS